MTLKVLADSVDIDFIKGLTQNHKRSCIHLTLIELHLQIVISFFVKWYPVLLFLRTSFLLLNLNSCLWYVMYNNISELM